MIIGLNDTAPTLKSTLVSLKLLCLCLITWLLLADTHSLTCREEDNSHLAFSAASLTLCSAMLSLVRSTPDCNKTTHHINKQHKLFSTTVWHLYILPACSKSCIRYYIKSCNLYFFIALYASSIKMVLRLYLQSFICFI